MHVPPASMWRRALGRCWDHLAGRGGRLDQGDQEARDGHHRQCEATEHAKVGIDNGRYSLSVPQGPVTASYPTVRVCGVRSPRWIACERIVQLQ